MNTTNHFHAKGNVWRRVRSILFLIPAWFSPHKSVRVFFHRLRGVQIGHNVEIGYFCIIGNVHPNMVIIEDDAVITARVTILEHDNAYYYTMGGAVRFGTVRIGKHAFIGIGAVILPGITIGDHSIVGALSLVSSDVPSWSVFAGAPAKLIKQFSSSGTNIPHP